MLKYDKALKLLEDAGYNTYKMKKTKLLSQSTYQKLKDGTTNLDGKSIDRLCKEFNCQPGDLMEWVPDEKE
ncbi:DNA-binding transcriptional regulator, XRE family [Lacrimispora sphenoides]|uniref:helix-turn-helix domain-containing protein n=1 Tax=Lacrimispora sphenoides TaxID=29370 RepID=UPI0008BFA306|nr:helix-turn-helix transcriptional regulator [Lacrimispora sphenoides]SET70764.1 DNA-binding transcriptional regulator, XRE family [Lacrimispora sphenoides]